MLILTFSTWNVSATRSLSNPVLDVTHLCDEWYGLNKNSKTQLFAAFVTPRSSFSFFICPSSSLTKCWTSSDNKKNTSRQPMRRPNIKTRDTSEHTGHACPRGDAQGLLVSMGCSCNYTGALCQKSQRWDQVCALIKPVWSINQGAPLSQGERHSVCVPPRVCVYIGLASMQSIWYSDKTKGLRYDCEKGLRCAHGEPLIKEIEGEQVCAGRRWETRMGRPSVRDGDCASNFAVFTWLPLLERRTQFLAFVQTHLISQRLFARPNPA